MNNINKTRSDSVWGKLPPKQRELLDEWFFEQNLSYREVQERAGKELGVKASRQSLSKYFHRRRREWESENETTPEIRDAEREIQMQERAGGSLKQEELEAFTLRHVALAAYEMSLADPKKLQVNDLQRLVRMLGESRKLALERAAAAHKEKMDELTLLAKFTKDQGHTKEQWEKIVTQTTEIMQRVKATARAENEMRKAAEQKEKNEDERVDGAAKTVDEGFAEGSKEPPDATLINFNQP